MGCTHATNGESGFRDILGVCNPQPDNLTYPSGNPAVSQSQQPDGSSTDGSDSIGPSFHGDALMMRHLTTLVLTGVLGTLVLAGNAEACHKKRCACAAPVACAPVMVCQRPAPPPKPVVCPKPVVMKTCAPKVKKCGHGGLFAKLFHKKSCAPAPARCATPVAYAQTYTTVVPSGQFMAAPQK
jgi:hypothetical protein